jgi:hypothetical protein
MPAVAPNGAQVFPLAEVRRGLRGVAYTVFEGVTPEPMTVEILGVLKDAIGPGQDMILARLGGEKAEYTGVVAGMSGSPVYVDGRLVGAISYRIGEFSKEPICGITPIEQMMEVRDGAAAQMQVAGERREAGSSAALRNDKVLVSLKTHTRKLSAFQLWIFALICLRSSLSRRASSANAGASTSEANLNPMSWSSVSA